MNDKVVAGRVNVERSNYTFTITVLFINMNIFLYRLSASSSNFIMRVIKSLRKVFLSALAAAGKDGWLLSAHERVYAFTSRVKLKCLKVNKNK